MSTDIDIDIALNYGGCDVRVAGTTRRFGTIDAAVDFTRHRLESGKKLREPTARCE